jgi:hypothetical protein
MSEVTNTVRRRVRGKSKIPALVHVNIRLPIEVLKFYKRYPQLHWKDARGVNRVQATNRIFRSPNLT